MSETMTTDAVHARPELLLVAETVARDKGIEQDEVLEAMEQAIQKAGRSKYGQEHDIRAHIDRTSGAISLARAALSSLKPHCVSYTVRPVRLDT